MKTKPSTKVDAVNHPAHYTQHPSGVECIQVTECMNFCLGNAVKYIWRAGLKGDAIQDLEKARWYLSREIERRERLAEIQISPERCAQLAELGGDTTIGAGSLQSDDWN